MNGRETLSGGHIYAASSEYYLDFLIIPIGCVLPHSGSWTDRTAAMGFPPAQSRFLGSESGLITLNSKILHLGDALPGPRVVR
jgi:hypothetical protein